MRFKLKKTHWIGLIGGALGMILSFVVFWGDKLFYFVLGIGVIVGILPFFIDLVLSISIEREKEEMFLEFSRNLVESVKSGTPISRSILNIRQKDYRSLSPYIDKLANQISIGIPVKDSLETFARDIGSKTISRAITLITEAEKAGGEIEAVLESVARSVGHVEKLRKERRAAIANLVVQGYIIFLIFIAIMLVMQFKILPIAGEFGDIGTSGEGLGGIGFGGFGGGGVNIESLTRSFLYLLLTQGFFAGLVIGKLSEGSVKSGLKHSFIMCVLALLISTGANAFMG